MSDTEGPYMHVSEYVQLKLTRNNLYLKLLDVHNKLLQKELVLNYRTFDLNKTKINLFKSVNEIEQQQLEQYIQEREEKVCEIYETINNSVPNHADELIEEIIVLRNEFLDLQCQIDTFNNQVPQELKIVQMS